MGHSIYCAGYHANVETTLVPDGNQQVIPSGQGVEVGLASGRAMALILSTPTPALVAFVDDGGRVQRMLYTKVGNNRFLVNRRFAALLVTSEDQSIGWLEERNALDCGDQG